jgi:hypothetical protein
MQEKELKRQERLREARRKHIVDFLKAEDVLQNNIRLQRIEEMKHSRTMQVWYITNSRNSRKLIESLNSFNLNSLSWSKTSES